MSRRAVAVLLTGPPADRGCPPGVRRDAFARALAEDVADLVADLPGIDALVAADPAGRRLADEVVWPGTVVLDVPAGAGPLRVLAALAERGYEEGAVLAPDAPDLPALLIAKPFSAMADATVAAVPALPPLAPLPPASTSPAELAAAAGPGRPAPTALRPSPDATARAGSPDAAAPAGWRDVTAPAGSPGALEPPGSPSTAAPLGAQPPGAAQASGGGGAGAPAAGTLAIGGRTPNSYGLVALASRLPAPAWLANLAVDLDTPDAVTRLRAVAPRRELVVAPAWHRLRTPADLAALDPGLEGWEATRALLSGH